MAVIKDMLSRMESEHKTKLEQLHIMQEQQRCHVNYYYYFINKLSLFCSFFLVKNCPT